MPRASAASPNSCASPPWPTSADSASPRTSPWKSISTSPPPTRASPGWNTSTGSILCSTSASKPRTAACWSRTAPGWASPSASRRAPGPQNLWNSASNLEAMSRNLTADLASDLRRRIVDGVLAPGAKLPSENTLISEFGVSRTVVRSALTRLQAEGLVETERGRGSFALTPPPDGPLAVPGVRPVATTEDRLHLLAFRMGVETEAAALAARNRTDRQLRAVGTALEAFTESAGHPAHAMKSDFEF